MNNLRDLIGLMNFVLMTSNASKPSFKKSREYDDREERQRDEMNRDYSTISWTRNGSIWQRFFNPVLLFYLSYRIKSLIVWSHHYCIIFLSMYSHQILSEYYSISHNYPFSFIYHTKTIITSLFTTNPILFHHIFPSNPRSYLNKILEFLHTFFLIFFSYPFLFFKH